MRNDIKLSLYDLTVAKLLVLFQTVIAHFTEHATLFTGAPYTVAQMETLHLAFAQAVSAAVNGSLADRKVRNKLMLEVRDMLRAQANFVRNVANGDETVLAKSGFELRRKPELYTEVGTPGRVVAYTTFQSDTIMLRWGKALAGRMYRAERALGDPSLPETEWESMGLTARQSMKISGLETYKQYYFRVVAIGIEAEGKPSDVVMGRAA